MEPRFVIRLSDRTPGNGLSTSHLQQIKNILLTRGMILLPSDTCYSLAAIPANKEMYQLINKILDRGSEPMSLAFNNFNSVERFVEINIIVANLLELFTPGPITIVCKAISKIYEKRGFADIVKEIINSSDGTIGVRIPDSIIEREIAGCTYYPVTTVAIRDSNGQIVQDFEKAIEIVSNGMKKNNHSNWAAIEGNNFFNQHSTVVRVNYTTNQCVIIREGEIKADQFKGIENRFPFWAYEDWR